MKEVVSYAQNREDLYIASFFPDVKTGFYVDIGAHDPLLESVTKFFYERGWSGINVEPQRHQIRLFERQRTRDINIQAGIADKPGELTLREYPGGGLSTFSPAIKEQYDHEDRMKETPFVEHAVRIITLKDVFEQYASDKKITFIKIDVEGLEYEVIKGNDWSKYRPELICIEANHIVKDWHPLLDSASYVQVFSDGLNEYYLAKESLYRRELFNYPERFLAGRNVGDSVLTYPTLKRITSIESERDKLTNSLALANEKIAQLESAAHQKEEVFEAEKNELHRQLQISKDSLHYHLKYLPHATKLRLKKMIRYGG